MAPDYYRTEAIRILEAPAWYAPNDFSASVAEWRAAAQRAVDGELEDFAILIDADDAQVWDMSERRREQWFAEWAFTPSELPACERAMPRAA